MNNQKKANPKVLKWISIICLLLIPIAGTIGYVYIHQDPFQLAIMAICFSVVSWEYWSKYKEKMRKL